MKEKRILFTELFSVSCQLFSSMYPTSLFYITHPLLTATCRRGHTRNSVPLTQIYNPTERVQLFFPTTSVCSVAIFQQPFSAHSYCCKASDPLPSPCQQLRACRLCQEQKVNIDMFIVQLSNLIRIFLFMAGPNGPTNSAIPNFSYAEDSYELVYVCPYLLRIEMRLYNDLNIKAPFKLVYTLIKTAGFIDLETVAFLKRFLL